VKFVIQQAAALVRADVKFVIQQAAALVRADVKFVIQQAADSTCGQRLLFELT
jgi:hypothetical protein